MMRGAIRPAAAASFAFLLFSLPCGAANEAATSDSGSKQVTLAQYEQELSRIDRQLKSLVDHPERAKDLRGSIPNEWQVQSASGDFEIENGDLRYKLDQFADNTGIRDEILPELQFRVEGQLESAKDFERPADASARGKLDAIFRRREYRNVAKSQSPLDKFKEIALGWLIRLLSRFFRAAAAHPRASEVLLWSIIGLVTLAFAVWIYFLLRRTTRDEYTYPRDGGALAPSYKHWQQWLREARAAADRGDWREAIHLAYWSGISYLESSGAWKPDRARTPREYLRMLPDVSGRREPLEALTKRFEFIWYAQQAASLGDFGFALTQLEKIGCR